MRSILSAFAVSSLCAGAATAADFDPKVLVITMFGEEAAPWLENETLDQELALPGLPQDYPTLNCNDDLCLMTTAMGFANAAASVTAVAFSDRVDLSDSYVLIAGIAGVSPEHGTLGSAHWATYAVDAGLRHQIDPREIPSDWHTGSFPLGATAPGEKPGWSAGTEIYALNEALAEAALAASQDVELADSEGAQSYRAQYEAEAATGAPFVSLCDTVSGDTYWHGALIAKDVEARVTELTDGKATYCTTQMEDNATLAALKRAADAGQMDFSRIAILRTGSNFDRPAPGQSAAASLAANSGGFGPATTNAYRVGSAFADEVISNWNAWSDDIPK